MANSQTENEIVITSMAPEHFESFHRALDRVARERQFLLLLEAPSLEDTSTFVAANLKDGNPFFVALCEDQVVGWCDIRRHGFETISHRGTLGIGILPGFRDQGIGHRLMMAAIDQAAKSGFKRIEFDVRADNATAIALYEKCGFVKEGEHRMAVQIDGTYFNSISMAKLL